LQHRTLRARHRPRNKIEVDLGNEPPLFVDGGSAATADRRRISLRWFSGTVLTALCGAALMGGAVYAALDRQANFAAIPERIEAALRGSFGSADRGTGQRKSDKLAAASETVGGRQTIRAPAITRVGEREVVRMRQYVRIMTNLTLTTSELSANIPAFDPRKLLANADTETATADETALAEPDAEVSFVMRDLSSLLPKLKIAAVLPLDQVSIGVREAANWSAMGATRPATAAFAGKTRLAYAPESGHDPYAGFEARIVPENITLLPKTTTQTTGGNSWNERTILAKRGDTVASILRANGATPDEIKAIVQAFAPRGRDGALKEGHKLRILLAPMASKHAQPIRVIVANDSAIEAVVALSDTGKYVAVDVQSADTQIADSEEDDSGTGVPLYQSVYETALRQNVPRPIIDELVRIYSYDVDFQRRVQPGDSFELLYSGEDENSDAKTDVLYAALTVNGEMKRLYRFTTPDDGVVDYYDETGKSAKKFLVRKPLGPGMMRSGYGWRRHPILGYSKMHTGVDWAAPLGTPIYASGNGSVEKIGWESGYGKYVRIRHNNGYQTAYGHMSAFARNVQVGARVRQGQVIGFVGSTGLSTGPHLHYEVLVNSRFVDPMRIKLPRGRVLEGAALASFERDRAGVDALMNRTTPQMAQQTAAAAER
jgi:murein DD-endopeptidase MepM/ murein hydrolase activator NlpD